MAKDYSDKEFKEIYQEVLDYVKTVSTKWDPSVSDESDPGVAILKAFALFIDKINYLLNYRHSQNSVDNVTDKIEGQRLFNQLGYQMKKKRSATGEISVKYIGTDSGTEPLVLNLFTTFSNQTGSQVYTSIRSFTQIPVGETRVIKVQEGTPLRYKYEGVEKFNSDNLTNNLRLPIMGIEELSDNGVIISSYDTDGNVGLVSDWLNIGDNFFNSVETKNLYSVGTDPDGVPYVQFYEESLPGLANGVGIWIISSAGAAGNIGQNKINRITSEVQDGGDPTAVSITHPEFTNGSDEESLESARDHYYETFGVNESLVSERDYTTALSGILGPDLKILTSMVLVTGVDGFHNIVKILSRVDTNKRVILTKFISKELIPWIFVNALKYTNDYYSSFDSLISEEDEKLIRKALFEKKVVSNETALVGKVKEGGTRAYNSTIYDKYLFDIVSPVGTVVVDTDDSIDQVKEEIVEIISNNFNSRNLEAGKMISESELAEAIRNELSGAIDASFYYSNHRISKKANSTSEENQLTTEEKRDIIARSVLAGETPLFKDEIIKIPPGATNIRHFPSKASSGGGGGTEVDTSKRIIKITGTPSFTGGVQDRFLRSNEFIQFYSVAQEEGAIYGSGVQYRLLANQKSLTTQTTITSTTTLNKGSVVAAGSQVYSPTLDPDSINASDPEGGVVTETATTDLFTFNKNYTVQNELVIETSGTDSYLQSGTVLSDGSTLNGEKVYGATIQDGVEFDLGLNRASLVLQPETSAASIITLNSGVIKVSGFSAGLNSSGPNDSGIGESPTFLTAGQTITQMVESSTTISSKFYYGLILPSKTNITLTADRPYVLEEGEHLIYSDENLLDFVDFGSGTLLSISGEGQLVLDNVITYEDDINTSLQKIPQNRDIKISNTNIYTYSGENYSLDLPADFILSADWVKVPSTATVTGPDGEKVFDGKFYHREGLIIETGEYNIFTITQGQVLILEDDQGGTQTIRLPEGTGAVGGFTLVSVSSPVYVNSSDNNLESGSNLQVSFYEFSQSTSNVTSNILYTIDSGFTIEVGYVANNGYATFNLNDLGYLLEVQAEIDPESIVEVTGVSTNPNGIKILNSNQNNTNISGPGTYQIFIYPNNTTSITFRFTSGKMGDKITIQSFRQIAGLNPDLDCVSEDGSQNYQPSTEFVFTDPTDEGVQLFNLINSYISSDVDGIIPFDFFYETESPLKNPTEAYKYYDTEHPLNRNILTVINLEDLRNNLKIVRRYRNDRS